MLQPNDSTFTNLSRRKLLKGTALGVGAAGIGVGVGAARQIELPTPEPATPEAVFPVEPLDIGATVASKAAELNFDVERMFRFVADEVQYEPYAGALRGANGTLWSLAGNSVDKAQLLAALLDEALIEYRFAFGALDDEGIATLMVVVQADPERLTEKFTQAQVNGLLPTPSGPFAEPVSTPEPDQPLTAEQEQVVDDLVATSTSILERAFELSDLNLALIQDALSAAGIEMPNADFVLPDEETLRHAWIQVADGPAWVDYAPTLSGAAAGVAPTSAEPETAAQVPTELIHTVTIRVVAEEFVGGTNVRRDAMSLPFASADLVNEPVALLVIPPQSMQSIGFTINALFTGQVAFFPAMLANDIGTFADSPLMFGSADGDIFSAPSEEGIPLAEGEALALWLAIDIASPGADLVTVERPLYDRIGFDARQAETIDFAAIEPVTMMTASDGQTYIRDLTPAYQLSIDSAYIPYAYAARDTERAEMFGELVMTNSGLLAIRDSLRPGLELPQGLRSIISGPSVTLVTGSKLDPEEPTSGVRIEIDMLHRSTTTIVLGGTSESLHPSTVTGVANQIAEQLMIEFATESAEATADVEFGANVGDIFAAAIDQNITVVSLSEMADLSDLDLEPEAKIRVASAIESGLIVVVPESSVELGGLRRSGWWLIDPVTGETRDELDNGKGSAGFSLIPTHTPHFSPFTEETFVIRLGSTASQYYRMLGLKILCYAGLFIAGAGIGMALALGPGGGGTAAAGAATSAAAGAAAAC